MSARPLQCSFGNITQLKVPFSATLPSLLYEQDVANPCFARFKEARAVQIRKEYMLQLCTSDFGAMVRCMEHFTSRVHHRVFLFLAEQFSDAAVGGMPAGRGRWRVRAFHLTQGFELREETDQRLVGVAWRDFQRSRRADHTMDECQELLHLHELSAAEKRSHPVRLLLRESQSVRKGFCEMKTRVNVPSWSTLAHYRSKEPDVASTSSKRWDVSMDARLLYVSSCNILSGCVDVPLLLPCLELCPPAGVQRNRADLQHAGGAETSADCSLLRALRRNPGVVREGWFRDSLIGARVHTISMYRDKSMFLCEMLDGRVFRFREHFPDVPSNGLERKHGGLFLEGGLSEAEDLHDDAMPTPNALLVQLTKRKREDFSLLDRTHPL